MQKGLTLGGFVAPGFERVEEAFSNNFVEGEEVGAAFAAVQDGVTIVDLWGGIADRRTSQPWSKDTLQVIFSGTKGLVATAILMLIDRGLLDLSAPVSRYWPEFFGKDQILIRHIVSHAARLPGIEAPITVTDLTNDRHMAALLAEQAPCLDWRAGYCYHALTFGWLCGEVIRRVSGVSVGEFFAAEIAAPLGLELWIGLPEDQEARVSKLEFAPDWGSAPFLDPAVWARDPLAQSIWGNPPHFTAEIFPWNWRAWHAAEIPGVNAIGTARSIAAFYGCLAMGGAPILSESAVNLGRSTTADGIDQILCTRRRTGVGFELQSELSRLGPPPEAFGHTGAGGSNHGAWPAQGVGYSYAMNLMRDSTSDDQRAQRLLTALYTSVIQQSCAEPSPLNQISE
jgi:CubicO group peptidase (beta-lactamase class C family)